MTAHDSASICPWLSPLWETLSEQRYSLSHALLIKGTVGTGKADFALALADLLLCTNGKSQACGECQVCVLGKAGSLPDLHVVTSHANALAVGGRLQLLSARYLLVRDAKSKPSEQLKIDQVRLLLDNIIGTAQIARHKVVVFAAAEQMNESAANALLKMLEEPPPLTWFVLTSNAPEHLPATIRSRCMLFNAPVPDRKQAHQWLDSTGDDVSDNLLTLAGSGPLQARRLADSEVGQKTDDLIRDYLEVIGGTADPVAVAVRWPTDECPMLLRLLQTVNADLIRIRTFSQTEQIALHQEVDRLKAMAARLDLMKVHGVYARLIECARVYDVALNSQLLLEDLLIRSSQMLSSTGDGSKP